MPTDPRSRTEQSAWKRRLAPHVHAWMPNAISVVRILLIPTFLLYAASLGPEPTRAERMTAVAILLTLGASDIVDGWLARAFDLGSNLGALLDAVADKLAQVALLTFFTLFASEAFTRTPIWFLAVVLGRDVLLGVGWLVVRLREGHVEVVHEIHGKASSTLMFALLVWVTAGGGRGVIDAACWALTLLIVLSTWHYVHAGYRQLSHVTGPAGVTHE